MEAPGRAEPGWDLVGSSGHSNYQAGQLPQEILFQLLIQLFIPSWLLDYPGPTLAEEEAPNGVARTT